MHIRIVCSRIFIALLLTGLLFPFSASAAKRTVFEVTGWIPYWRAELGTTDALAHLDSITEVNPFVYTLKSDGTIVDNGKLTEEPWVSFIVTAKARGVRVIPTIMSGDGAAIHALLSNTKKRIALEDAITKLVKDNGYDGIDIDFEGKKAATKKYFSTFLKGLYMRMGNKWVMCTIESRTPLADRYYGSDIPRDAAIFANDFKMINKYCDRVRIMAYDQQGIDQKLAADAETNKEVYAPVADPRWVEKTVRLAMKDIRKDKILIGVPTYGYEYDVTAYANNQYIYRILWTFNPGYALPIAAQYGVTPQRNSAGEMFFTYVPTSASSTPPAGSTSPVSMSGSALAAAAAASNTATQNNTNITFRLMDWPDAESLNDKILLAKKLGVRGISIFKIDGGEDPNIWNVLKGVKK